MREAENINKPHRETNPSAKSEIEYRNTIAALEERLRFQDLISEISAILINLPAGEVDGQVERALKRIVEFLGIDRSSFGEFSEDRKELRATHSYAAPGIEPFPKIIVAYLLPWYLGKLLRTELVVFENFAYMPDKAVAEGFPGSCLP